MSAQFLRGYFKGGLGVIVQAPDQFGINGKRAFKSAQRLLNGMKVIVALIAQVIGYFCHVIGRFNAIFILTVKNS